MVKNILLRIQTALIEATKPTREVTEAGGFVVLLTPDDPLIWINYAVPTSEATPDDVDEMTSVFRKANRTPRLEFFADLWSDTITSLEQRGFICEKQMPIMVLNRDEWQGLKHNHEICGIDAQMFHEFNKVLSEAFGMDSVETTSDPLDDPNYQRIASGATLACIAIKDGRVVGGGLGVGTQEIREIAGIGTLKDFRKQGIASAVIAHLLDQFFAQGGEIAWLTPGDDSAQSVYSNLGFRTIAEQVVYELPNVATA
ncbi:MAG: GNAT family N-acetyltransferase [Armatimonadota bacterium]